MNEANAFEILAAVNEIPRGRVATYGQIADLIGQPSHARLVGRVLACAEYFGNYPCHRVVSSTGRLAPNFAEQRSLLEAEDVKFKKNGCVDLKHYQWDGN